MSKAPSVSYNLVLNKGGTLKRKDTDGLKADLDRWFTTLIENKAYTKYNLNPRIVQARLEGALTKMYSRGLMTALESWIGVQSAPMGDSKGRFIHAEDSFIDRQIETKHPLRGTKLAEAFKKSANLSVKWAGLTNETRGVKMHHESQRRKPNARGTSEREAINANKHFIDTGSLKAELTRTRREMIKKTGIVKVSVDSARNKKGQFAKVEDLHRSFPISTIRIRLLPNITKSMLPGLASGNWTKDTGDVRFERALGISEENLQKLGNTHLSWIDGGKGKGNKRPLFQPVFTYYTMFEAPKTAANVMIRLLEIEKRRRVNND